MDDRICPRIPLAFYGWEDLPGTKRGQVHGFLGIVQREAWLRESRFRKILSPTSREVWASWGDFSLILHPDTRKRMSVH